MSDRRDHPDPANAHATTAPAQNTQLRADRSLGRGVGLHDPDFITYRRQLVARGKPPLVALIAVGHRAHRLAFAMLRSQRPFDSDRWEADQILSQVDMAHVGQGRSCGVDGPVRRHDMNCSQAPTIGQWTTC